MLGDPLFELSPELRPYGLQIEATNAEVRNLCETHHRSRRRVDQLLTRKKEAVKDYSTAFVRVARQFEDLCRLAGLGDLADKVRPSLIRKGETAVEPEDGEVPAAPAGTSGGAEGDSGPPVEGAAARRPALEPDAEAGGEPESTPAKLIRWISIWARVLIWRSDRDRERGR